MSSPSGATGRVSPEAAVRTGPVPRPGVRRREPLAPCRVGGSAGGGPSRYPAEGQRRSRIAAPVQAIAEPMMELAAGTRRSMTPVMMSRAMGWRPMSMEATAAGR